MITTPKLGLKKYELTDTWALQDQNENLDKIDAAVVTVGDLALKADLASPAFTGNPTAPTPAVSDNDTSLATTAHVRSQTIRGTGVSVTNTGWTNSSIPGRFVRAVTIAGVVAEDYPTLIAFNADTIAIAEEAGISYVECYNGGVALVATAVPTASVVFDYVITKA